MWPPAAGLERDSGATGLVFHTGDIHRHDDESGLNPIRNSYSLVLAIVLIVRMSSTKCVQRYSFVQVDATHRVAMRPYEGTGEPCELAN